MEQHEVKKYYPHLDLLKGIAILLMVMGHAIAWSYPDWHFLAGSWQSMSIEQFNASFVWKVIYSFHMPLLFFVSGFLFYKSDTLTFGKVKVMLNKRIQRLFIPYITTGFFVFFLKGYFGYWFFIVLFVLNIIVIAELFIESMFKIGTIGEICCHSIVFVVLFCAGEVYKVYLPDGLTNLEGLSKYYLYFMFGYHLHKCQKLESIVMTNTMMSFSFVFYVILMVVVTYFGKIKMLGLFIPLFASSFLYCFAKKKKDVIGLGGVKMIGKYSMEIYVFHLFFVMQIPAVGQYLLSLTNFPTSITVQLTYSLLLAFIAIFFSLIMGKIVNSNQYISKILLGK